MAHYTGANVYILYESAGGTVTASGDQRSLDLNFSVNTADTTAGSDTWTSQLTTTRAMDGSFKFLADDSAGGGSIRQIISQNLSGTITIGYEGTASGKPKEKWPVTITGSGYAFAYDGETEVTVNFKQNGAYVESFEINGDTY